MGWHVFNIKVVLQQGVSHGSGVVCLLESLGELSRIFVVEQDLDSVELALFLGVFPVALISLRGIQVLGDLEFSPVLKTISISPETLTWDFSLGNLRALLLLSFLALGLLFRLVSVVLFYDHPVFRCSLVHVLVVISF